MSWYRFESCGESEILCDGVNRVSVLKYNFVCSHEHGRALGVDDADPEQPESETAEAHYVWQYLTVTNNTAARKGGSKNDLCLNCKPFSGCSTSRAAAHILARPVMGQDIAGVQPCVAVNKKDDRRAALRKAQKQLAKSSVLKNNQWLEKSHRFLLSLKSMEQQ